MKDNKNELKNLKVQARRKKKKIIDSKWIIKITLITFFISFVFSFLSETIIPAVNTILGVILAGLFLLT